MVKNPAARAGDAGLIPGSGRSSGEGNGKPLQYSCLLVFRTLDIDYHNYQKLLFWIIEFVYKVCISFLALEGSLFQMYLTHFLTFFFFFLTFLN